MEMEQMVLAARQKGMCDYGLSDHWVVRPDGFREDWSMKLEDLDAYVETCESLKRKYTTPSFHVWTSLEVEFFKENAVEVISKLRKYPFDYLIGAVHFVDYFSVDNNPEDWNIFKTDEERDRVFHGYWANELALCQSGLYDLIAHLDLPKKFGFAPTYDNVPEWEAALQALAASGKVMEINTAGWDKPCNDSYPSLPIISRARELGIPIVFSSDSHEIEHIGRNYGKTADTIGATLIKTPSCSAEEQSNKEQS
ncbi:MAG: histidinol-phosphatase [Victivallales bacterium]|nr:histidinol-phosphatase [Victivallales bacterium]